MRLVEPLARHSRGNEKEKSENNKTECQNKHFQKNKNDHDNDTDENEISITLDDENDTDIDPKDIIEGNFVVVQVHEKEQLKFFIARVDFIDVEDCEGVFLKRLPHKVNGLIVFVPNECDAASFVKNGVLDKLHEPKRVGGTKRTECQLMFQCNLDQWYSELLKNVECWVCQTPSNDDLLNQHFNILHSLMLNT